MKKLWKDALHGAIEYLMLSLLLTAIVLGLLPEGCPEAAGYLFLAGQLAYCLLGPLLWTVFRGKVRAAQLILGLFCCAGGLILTFRWIPYEDALFFLSLLLAVGLFVRGYCIAAKPWDEIAPAHVYTILIFINLVFMVAVGALPSLERYRTPVTIVGPVVALASLLTMNSINMQSVVAIQRDTNRSGAMAVSKTMKAANRAMVLLTFGVVLVFSLFGSVSRWILRLFGALYRWLVGSSDGTDTQVAENAEAVEDELMNEVREEAARRAELSPALQKLFHVLMTVAAVIVLLALFALLVYALYKLVQKLIELYRKMIVSGTQNHDSGVEEYTDVAEHLQVKDVLHGAADRLKSRLDALKREPAWDSLSIPEKVRYLYRHTVQKAIRSGWQYSPAMTPRQATRSLSRNRLQSPEDMEALGQAYDAVRYGEKTPDAAAVEQLHSHIS